MANISKILMKALLTGCFVLGQNNSSLAQSAASAETPKKAEAIFEEILSINPGDEEMQTLKSVLQKAYLDNPALLSARSDFKSVAERVPQVMANWLPTVTASTGIEEVNSDGQGEGRNNQNFSRAERGTAKDVRIALDQTILRGGRTFSEYSAAKHIVEAQRNDLIAAEQNLLQRVVTAYMDVLRDRALLRLSKNNRVVIARRLEAARDRYDVGETTLTDVSQAEARLARADADVISAEGNLSTSEAVFEELTGITPLNLAYPKVMIDLPNDLDTLNNRAESENPLIVAAKYAHRAAEKDVSTAFRELFPEISLSASWSRTYDPVFSSTEEQTDRRIALRATIPLYEGGGTRSRIRQAKQDANANYMDILDIKRRIRQQTVSDFKNLQAAKAEIISRQAQVEASEVAREGVRQETLVGTRTVLDSLDADQELLDAQVALVTAMRNKVVADFALAQNIGALTPENLGFTEKQSNYNTYLNSIRWKLLSTDTQLEKASN